MNIQALLSEKVRQAMIAAGAPADCEPQVRQSAKVQFGDYQANGMMAVAKKLGMAPRQLAEQVLTHLDLNGIASKVEIAGPGFINIFLIRHSWLNMFSRRWRPIVSVLLRQKNKPLWLTTLRQTWRKRCMSVTCALPLLVTQQFVLWSSSVTK